MSPTTKERVLTLRLQIVFKRLSDAARKMACERDKQLVKEAIVDGFFAAQRVQPSNVEQFEEEFYKHLTTHEDKINNS